MPDTLRSNLETTLGSAYRVERELSAGGMSRVFVARDAGLGREVVIKVLSETLAESVNAERFAREIKLAAALQDPHIVPVLAAGTTRDGLPYYTMPFVRGDSLRARLDAGPVPREQALQILRDVAIALEYAHRERVVHRDIKPENILLSGRTAVVTDFGIAKALSVSSTATQPGAATLTGMGVSIGTPAYMAPEQAVGDSVDERADIYSWGIVAYELLSGRHPFADRHSAQQLIAAHVADVPPALEDASALATLVARALAKKPADRPSSAAELIAALDAAQTAGATAHDGDRARRRWPRRRTALAVGTVLVVVIIGGWFVVPAQLRAALRVVATRQAPRLVVNRVVVAPFKDETGDPKLAVLGGLAADYVTQGLARLRSLQVVDTRTAAVGNAIVSRIPRLLRPGSDRALAQETGARVVVVGSYYLESDSIRFLTRIIDAESGDVRQSLAPVVAPASTPTQVVTLLTQRVVAALRSASDTTAMNIGLQGGSPPPSIEAFEAWRQGMDAYLARRSAPAVLGPLMQSARLDSTWATALASIAWTASDLGLGATADSAMQRAARLPELPTSDEALFLRITDARARGDIPEMLGAAQRLSMPNEQLVAYAATLARRPRLVVQTLAGADPDRGLNLALPDIYWARLFNAAVELGDYDRALAAAREAKRRGVSPSTTGRESLVAAARGDVPATERLLQRLADEKADPGRLAVAAVSASTVLRLRAGQDSAGLRIARAFAERLFPAGRPMRITQPMVFIAPLLLCAAERWQDAAQAADGAFALADSLSRVGRRIRPVNDTTMRRSNRAVRAVALIHLGRRNEAMAIDSAFAAAADQRWDMGESNLYRAAIAAHLGESDRAMDLLNRAVARGALNVVELGGFLPSVDGVVLLAPLRGDPRFHTLALADPTDAAR